MDTIKQTFGSAKWWAAMAVTMAVGWLLYYAVAHRWINDHAGVLACLIPGAASVFIGAFGHILMDMAAGGAPLSFGDAFDVKKSHWLILTGIACALGWAGVFVLGRSFVSNTGGFWASAAPGVLGAALGSVVHLVLATAPGLKEGAAGQAGGAS